MGLELPHLSLAQRLVACVLLVAAEPDAFAELVGLEVGTYSTPYVLAYAMLGWLLVGVFTDRRAVASAKAHTAIKVTRAVSSEPDVSDERFLAALRDAGISPETVAAALAREKKRERSSSS